MVGSRIAEEFLRVARAERGPRVIVGEFDEEVVDVPPARTLERIIGREMDAIGVPSARWCQNIRSSPPCPRISRRSGYRSSAPLARQEIRVKLYFRVGRTGLEPVTDGL